MSTKEDVLFKNEKTLFQKQINSVLKDRDNVKIIEDIVKLILLKNASRANSQTALVEAYNYFGLESFVDLVDIMSGKTVTFPTVEEFKDTLKTAISYYYKYIKRKNWDEIKMIMQDDKNNSYIKYGINCSKLNRFITELAEYEKFVEKNKPEEIDG